VVFASGAAGPTTSNMRGAARLVVRRDTWDDLLSRDVV
jgi:hypothetical protein